MNTPCYDFFCPVKIVAGVRSLEHLPHELSNLSASRPMIITDIGVRQAGLVDHVTHAFDDSNITIIDIFDDVPPDSSTSLVSHIADRYRQLECDCIIAIGGGSVIDTSKGVNILVSEGGNNVTDYSGVDSLKRPLRPFFVIPTTAGTGSEVTSVAVIADSNSGVKHIFTCSFLLPNVAILDPRMTKTLPPHITAATAIDALTHAIEAFTCMGKNPLSDTYATAAIRKISENILKVMDNPEDELGRLELAQASTMAGIAFSNSMVGLIHALGHSLGVVCHIPHGLCMSIFLPHALEYNLHNGQHQLSELLLPLAGAEVYSRTPTDQRSQAVINFIHDLKDDLFERCQLPRSLSETGKVNKEHFARIVELTVDDAALILNPIEVDRDDAMALLHKAW
ncbi:alcohol dehydrogenase [Gammaproteobacteria bacterium 45_16_T64]|nr:alcohol dehydrogenase [Gammaproteobacteria bacterium 45_16_T64]